MDKDNNLAFALMTLASLAGVGLYVFNNNDERNDDDDMSEQSDSDYSDDDYSDDEEDKPKTKRKRGKK